MERIAAEILYRPDDDALRFLPEGPYASGSGRLSWVAIQHGADSTAGSLNVFDIASRTNETFNVPGRPGFAFPTDRDGVFVLGVERQIGLFDLRTRNWRVLADGIDNDVAGTIINDGVTFDDHLLFGCKDLAFAEKKAGLYLWRGTDGRLIQLRNDQTCSNGKAVIRAGADQYRLLDIDTPTKTVVEYVLDVATATIDSGQVVLDLTQEDMFPDGMILTPDQQSVVIAFYNPNDAPHGEARQYSLESRLVECVWTTAGAPQVTCPQLIDSGDGVKLVLTTAVEHMSPERRQVHVNSGCLFIADTAYDSVGHQPVFSVTPR